MATLLSPGGDLYFYLLYISAVLGPWLDMWQVLTYQSINYSLYINANWTMHREALWYSGKCTSLKKERLGMNPRPAIV